MTLPHASSHNIDVVHKVDESADTALTFSGPFQPRKYKEINREVLNTSVNCLLNVDTAGQP